MIRILGSLLLCVFASSAIAQNCFRVPLGTSLGSGGDTVYAIQPIGFAFPFAGTTYTDVHICSKGYVYLSNAGVPAPGAADFSATAAELASGSPRVCALWSDIQVLGGACWIRSTPTACTITWKDANIYSTTAPLFDLQMTLMPSGLIECIYGPGVTNNSVVGQPTWQVGVAGVSPGLGVALPAASDLSAGGATADNTLFEEWLTPATFDMAVTGLTMIPTNPGWAFVDGASMNCASNTVLGQGCIRSYTSFYENFTSAGAFDLASSSLMLIAAGGTYVVTAGGSYNAVGSLSAPTSLTLTDDSSIATGTLGLTVGSNGWVALGAGNSNGFTPDVPTLLDNPATAFYCWHDYNPAAAGSGLVKYEEAGTMAQITFDGVYDYGGTSAANANNLQFQIDTATGNVVIAWGTMSTLGNAFLVGYSPGGTSLDPGNSNLSDVRLGLSVITTGTTDIVPLSLAAISTPALGASWNLEVRDIPVGTVFGVNIFGVSDPGIPDLFFLGMPGCQLRASLDAIVGPWFPAGSTHGYSFPVPATPASLVGFNLFTQAATFGVPPVNAFGAVTSGGVKGTIGY
ncbi:MAG TPA: hypothetical protein VFZ65_19580 [Planctomycetota bacterium]|nr:hypothetical protein [Planctomycetota bacterium]